MARQGKALPARRTRPAMDESLLIRSAESLGRMIGSLQRQLDGASKMLNNGSGRLTGVFGVDTQNVAADGSRARKTARPSSKTAVRRGGAPAPRGISGDGNATQSKTADKGGSKSGATKVRSTADRKSKRASKSAGAKQTAGRSRSAASRTSPGKSSKRSRTR